MRSAAALARAGRPLLTLVLVVIAATAGKWLWVYYQAAPWTRDGRVRVDVANVAPDVSGLVTEVDVVDNMPVHKGQPLFVIDRPRYQFALQQTEAALQQATAGLQQAEAGVQVQATLLEQARREDVRNRKLGSLVPTETVEQGAAHVAQLQATLAQAEAAVSQARATLAQATAAHDIAALNLERTTVLAQVDGVAANVQLQPGSYLTAGHAAFGIADAASLHVDGYFEETKLAHIHIGDRVTVVLMGDSRPLEGHVESIAPGIADRERSPSGDLLANVNPTFNWVRLAQRIPVRIHIDQAPADLRLIAGRTATVVVHPSAAVTNPSRLSWLW
ncbi:MAG TPA: HlyD family secretion protein [Roseiarcus sp.]|jgi:multidrug resistance efflux pump